MSAHPVRLQKYLAACGVGSRRRCEELMIEGRITVDGVVVRTPGTSVIPGEQEVRCNGQLVAPQTKVYLALHKPPGHVCTSHDPQGRPCAIDLIPAEYGRVFTIGRLDTDSEGLILLTNDGEFSNRLMHPRYEVTKTYELWLREPLDATQQQAWLKGIASGGDTLKVLGIRAFESGKAGHGYRLTLGEGKNRHIRRMAEAQGATVLRLVRVAIGGLVLGRLKRGQWRALSDDEVRALSGAPRTTPRRPPHRHNGVANR